MSHYFTDTKAAIVAFLNTSTKVRNIYAYENTKPDGYPAICVTSSTSPRAVFIDTMRTDRDFEFIIRVYQERAEVGAAQADIIVDGLVDELIAIFESVTAENLNNTVTITQPPTVRFGYLNDPNSDVRTAELTLTGRTAQ